MRTFRFMTEKYEVVMIVAPNVRVAIATYRATREEMYISVEMIF